MASNKALNVISDRPPEEQSNDGFRSRSHSETISSSTKDPDLILKSINEIKSPFEEEAESTILRAIEAYDQQKQEEECKIGTRDTSLGILTGVPAEAIHLFSHSFNDHETFIATKQFDTPSESIGNPPGMTEIVNRMRMIKMRNSRHLNIKSDNTCDNTNEISNMKDPESLQRIKSFDESSYQSDMETECKASIRQQSSNQHVKSYYRRFCNPCYSLTSFIYIRWKDIKYILVFFLYILVPLLGISGIMFYWGGNPMGPMNGSWSWWLIFVARILICLVLSQLTQFVIIDFICLETQIAVRFIGRLLTLMAVQSKGWPVLSIFWSMWQFILLHGSPAYNSHWLYRQDVFDIFNETNPSASITTNVWYLRILISMIILGIAVMFKRVYISLSLGKKKYVAYGPQMESIMRKVLLVAEVAMLAEEIEYSTITSESLSHMKTKLSSKGTLNTSAVSGGWLFSGIRRESVIEDPEDEAGSVYSGAIQREPDDVFQIDEISDCRLSRNATIAERGDEDGRGANTFTNMIKRQLFNKTILKRETKKIFNESDRIAMEKLLGEWEEPERYKKASWKDTSIQKVLEFRETLIYMDGTHPLSVPFGPASTRKECLKSSQKVYQKLLLQSPEDQILQFETLLFLSIDKTGILNKRKARALIRLFRPDRKGNLTLLDFVRTCDHLYKKVKLFRATTANVTQLDDALENLLNVVFYTILTVVLLLVMQVDFLTVFSTLAGIILPLSFLFSTAASLYFQGVLLVLVRQPYDIGDRIALSKPENDTDKDGSTSWFVEQISLFSTTLKNAATNEVATLSNSSLAPLRIINAARSPKAVKTLRLKFAIDVSLEKINLFGSSVEEFIKERPREWVKMACFRPTLIEADLGFVQYIVVLQHQESWQNIGSIKKSLADVASFSLELSKKLEMKYHTPPIPVNLSLDAAKYSDRLDPSVDTNLFGEGILSNESNSLRPKDAI